MADVGSHIRTLGRYVLFDVIAAGGMATVHLARMRSDGGFSMTVAIKRLHRHLAMDPAFVAMFVDEARLAARIRHRNVVGTLDVLTHEGELLLVMEYVPGLSLARILRNGRPPAGVAVRIVADLLRGLDAAHEAVDERGKSLEIVHRDVSPENVLVDRDGVAHVLDFGIAKARGRAQSTREGELKGKLAYMAREQIVGGRVDRRCDVHAAGVVLWEALTGESLRRGLALVDAAASVRTGGAPAPSSRVAGLSSALDAVVLRALSPDPDERFATAREMVEALEKAMVPSSAQEVGAFVAANFADVLAQMDAMVSDVERRTLEGYEPLTVLRDAVDAEHASARDERAELPTETGVVPPSVHPPVGGLEAPRKRSRKFVITSALVVLIGALATLHWSRQRPSREWMAGTPAAASMPSAMAEAAMDAPEFDAPEFTERIARGVASVGTGSDVPSRPPKDPASSEGSRSSEGPRVGKVPRHVRQPAPRHSGHLDRCEVPYVVDRSGIRRIKTDCALIY